ncbi:MAG: hypothetical protein MK160_13030 [Rhodobacteraceae bacterium]|nr:hypothetical protein [Paracoccaceae bacterium]
MFQNWGFLVTEMVTLIIIAALLGLFVGWLIWGRRSAIADDSDSSQLRAELEACQAKRQAQDQKIAELTSRMSAAAASVTDDTLEPVEEPQPEVSAPVAQDDTEDPSDQEPSEQGVKPEALAEARDGMPDDLKQIKGIGPKLESLCNRLGFFHFDQIAAWTEDEVAWVDQNLEGFKGRVTRDNWVAQAQVLAAGGATEFSDRVKDGDVY